MVHSYPIDETILNAKAVYSLEEAIDRAAFVTCENVLTVKVSTAPFESRMGSQAVAIPEQSAVGVLD